MRIFFTRFSRLIMFLTMCAFVGPQLAYAQINDPEVVLPTITSFSTDFLAVTSDVPYSTTIAVYGEQLDYFLGADVSLTLGPLTATSVAGNSTGMNVTFTVDTGLLPEVQVDYPLVISAAGIPVVTTAATITIYNPYLATYAAQRPRQYLKKVVRPHRRTKQMIGLNVHWTLGSDSTIDDLYAKRLTDSSTAWTREHFSYKLLMGDDSAAWLKRYDQTMLRYDALDMHVVGMLAYGSADDEFAAPHTADWKRFVRMTVKRYRNYVDVWEIWNEPDSADYLQPNTWKTYRPLLKTGAAMIREYDPDAIVLNGAVADITHHQFIQQLYTNGQRYFDELNVHLYYCDEYRDDNEQLTRLEEDWAQLQTIVQKYREHERIWITELGCSTGLAGVNTKLVKRYLNQATKFLLAQQLPGLQLGPMLLYTIRDRVYLDDDPYEAYFGLLNDAVLPKRSWRWYKKLPQK